MFSLDVTFKQQSLCCKKIITIEDDLKLVYMSESYVVSKKWKTCWLQLILDAIQDRQISRSHQ